MTCYEGYFISAKGISGIPALDCGRQKIALRIGELLQDILRNPFAGIGKPEPLKHEFKGFWSRRINSEHRLIYKVTEEQIIVATCYSHYQ